MSNILNQPSAKTSSLVALERSALPRGRPTSRSLNFGKAVSTADSTNLISRDPSAALPYLSQEVADILEASTLPRSSTVQQPLPFPSPRSMSSSKGLLVPPSAKQTPRNLQRLENQSRPPGRIARGNILSATPPVDPKKKFDDSTSIGRPSRRHELNQVANILSSTGKLKQHGGLLYLYGVDGPIWTPVKTRRDAARLFRKLLSDRPDITDGLLADDYAKILEAILSDPSPQLQLSGEFGDHGGLLNCIDGVLDARSPDFTILPHDPSHNMLSYVNVSCRAIQRIHQDSHYRRQFRYGYFESFIQRMSNGDPEKGTMLLQCIALTAIGHEGAKAFYCLYGRTNTGKSQIGKLLQWLAGDSFTHAIDGLQDFANPFTKGDLCGKSLAICMDHPNIQVPKFAIGAIKELSGDDPINGKVKYGHSFTYNQKPLLVIASNFPVTVRDEGFMQRMHVIPFDSTPIPEAQQIRQLHLHLRDEAPYILWRAVLAYQEYIHTGRLTRVELPPEWAYPEPHSDMDSVCQFLRSHVVQKDGAQVSSRQLFQVYRNNVKNATLSFIGFSRLLPTAIAYIFPEAKYKKAVSGDVNRGYEHLALMTEPLEQM